MSWQTYPLPEPINVEAGKTYEVTWDNEGAPSLKEQPDGGLLFEKDGAVMAVGLFVPDAGHRSEEIFKDA